MIRVASAWMWVNRHRRLGRTAQVADVEARLACPSKRMGWRRIDAPAYLIMVRRWELIGSIYVLLV